MEYSEKMTMVRRTMPRSKDNLEIGNRLELTRRALGYDTQTEFIAALEPVMQVSQQRYNAYEAGRERITVPVVLALHARWGVDFNWVYLGKRGELPSNLRESIERIEVADLRRQQLRDGR